MRFSVPIHCGKDKSLYEKFVRQLQDASYPIRTVDEGGNLSVWIDKTCIAEWIEHAGFYAYPAGFARNSTT